MCDIVAWTAAQTANISCVCVCVFFKHIFWLQEKKQNFKSCPHSLKYTDFFIFVLLPLIYFATLNPSPTTPSPPLPAISHTHTCMHTQWGILLCQPTFRRLTSKLPKGIPTLLHPQPFPPPFSVFPSLPLPLCEYLRNKWRRCRAPWVLEGWVVSQRAVITPPLRWFKGPGTCWPMHGTKGPALHWHLPSFCVSHLTYNHFTHLTLFILCQLEQITFNVLTVVTYQYFCQFFGHNNLQYRWLKSFVYSINNSMFLKSCLVPFKREVSFMIIFTTLFSSPVLFSGHY